ncbi:MAG: hypothetical protein HFI16_01040 [Lachnospiraceae bacterium]|nr:hypothetical protein [Lachnospiraceae bacterium]
MPGSIKEGAGKGAENGSGCVIFFDGKPEALLLYEAFEERVFSEVDGVKVKVQKTQIAFSNRCQFAFVSFLPVRKAKERPEVYIVVTFGLGYRLKFPRIDAAVEPYPGRFTHHVMVSGTGEIDDELMKWVKEAAAFSASKR